MSDFDDLLSDGFAEMLGTVGNCSLTLNGQTCQGISTAIGESKEMRDAGYWPHFSCTVEIIRADFCRLKIADRAQVVYADADGKKITLKVIGIDGAKNDGDPCTRLTLKEDPS